jgi:N-acetylmuramoyl-L-alanine amidase
MGYLSNRDEESRLKQAGYRERIAFGIFDGLVKWRTKVRRLALLEQNSRF